MKKPKPTRMRMRMQMLLETDTNTTKASAKTTGMKRMKRVVSLRTKISLAHSPVNPMPWPRLLSPRSSRLVHTPRTLPSRMLHICQQASTPLNTLVARLSSPCRLRLLLPMTVMHSPRHWVTLIEIDVVEGEEYQLQLQLPNVRKDAPDIDHHRPLRLAIFLVDHRRRSVHLQRDHPVHWACVAGENLPRNKASRPSLQKVKF